MYKLLFIIILQYIFGGMAYNHTECASCPTPTPEPIVIEHATPTIEPTPIATPTPTIEPTPWTCPIIGDLSKQDYKQACLTSCKDAGLTSCGKICKDCYE